MTDDENNLLARLYTEAESMKAAVHGECLYDTFHLMNWQDKPHRVVFDATKLMIEAADRIAVLEAALASHRKE